MRKSSNPRVVNYLAALTFLFKGRVLVFQKSFAPILFALFLGFLVANIFGTFLGVFRSLAIWDGFVIFGLVLFVELISYATYRIAKRQFMRIVALQSTEGKPIFWRITNTFKVGLLLGFFVEAFKVGS